MNNNDHSAHDDDIIQWRFVAVLVQRFRLIAGVTFGVAIAAVLAGGFYFFWLQPVRTYSVLEFRPTFRGADTAEYPNGLPFQASDIAARPFVDAAFDLDGVKDYCSREQFRTAVSASARSADKLAVIVERTPECAAIPKPVEAKILGDVLNAWAFETAVERGALAAKSWTLDPSAFAAAEMTDAAPLPRADELHRVLEDAVASVTAIERLPGASLFRFGPGGAGFAGVRDQLGVLTRSGADPLVRQAQASTGPESIAWLRGAVAAADREAQTAAKRAAALRDALNGYAGSSSGPLADVAVPKLAEAFASDRGAVGQAACTAVNSIVTLSTADRNFRQGLAERLVDEQTRAADIERRSTYYKAMLASAGQGRSDVAANQAFEAQFRLVLDRGKSLMAQFNEISRAFVTASLGTVYQDAGPMTVERSRPFSGRNFLSVVLEASLLAFAAVFGIALVRDRFTNR